MPRRPRWNRPPVKDGVMEVGLLSWKYFHDFVYQQMLERISYVWRGQRLSSWRLSSTLDRDLGTRASPTRDQHLEAFQLSVRGRRGPHPPTGLAENDWWALGQHYGLGTPLLDWTASPFVAAFFAFAEKKLPQTPQRAIWAFALGAVLTQSEKVRASFTGTGRPPIVEAVKPMSDENPRLVSQGGLFTRAPDGTALEDWVRANFTGVTKAVLVKFTFPNADRDDALRSLNRMNINHLSLFPDLYGASAFCNLKVELANY